jgi:LytS/YehU family sensor histidine kinase
MMQSLWFRVLLVALFILGLFLFLRARLKLIRIQEHEKTSLNKKIAEMEMKALRAQMNPHFTFNALNSIQHLIMQQELGAAQKYLAQFSKLLRSVLENSRLTTITLDEELKAIQIYLSLEGLRFGNAFEYQLTLDPDINQVEIKIPSMMIQPFLENAIWHGLILKEGQRLLKLNILVDGEYLICSIEDNGIGREASSHSNSWKEGYRSMGMEVTKERLQLLNSTSDKVANFQIFDLHDEFGMASGTRIELKIPYEEEFN